MDLDETIKSNRQYKRFTDKKKIDQNALSAIIDSGLKVNSTSNILSQHFIIIEEEKIKKELMPYLLKQIWALQAPVWIVVCFDPEEMQSFFKNNYEVFCLQDTSFSVQNMQLKATSLNINHYFIRSFKETEVKEALRIPDKFKIAGILILGHGKGQGEKDKVYRLDKHISFERYNLKKTDSIWPLKKTLQQKIKKKSN